MQCSFTCDIRVDSNLRLILFFFYYFVFFCFIELINVFFINLVESFAHGFQVLHVKLCTKTNLKDEKWRMKIFDKFIISYKERCDWLVKFTS